MLQDGAQLGTRRRVPWSERLSGEARKVEDLMRNLLALLGALVVTFLVAGYFLGWYSIQSVPSSPGHHKVNIDVDGTKIRQDLNKSGEQIRDWIGSKTQDSTEKSPQTLPPLSPATPSTDLTPPPVIVRPKETTPSGGWWIFKQN